MTTATPTTARPEPRLKRAVKLHAERCACCNRELKNPGTLIPGIGIVGPECETKLAGRMTHLQAAGLAAFFRDGEVRLAMLPAKNGCWRDPVHQYTDWKTRAGRVGLELSVTRDFSDKANPVMVLTLKAKSVQRWFRTGRSATAGIIPSDYAVDA